MFGTLRLNPSDAGPIFVERADGAAFSALGNNVPQHTACDQCRQKKLRCTGRKSGCDRCKVNSIDCTYTQLYPGNGRRRERNRRPASSSQHSHSTSSRSRSVSAPSQPSPEQQQQQQPLPEGEDSLLDASTQAHESIVVASTGTTSTRKSKSPPLPPVKKGGAGGRGDESNGTSGRSSSNASSSSGPLIGLGDQEMNFLEDHQDSFDGVPNGGSTNGWNNGDFNLFDLDTTMSPRAGFDPITADSNLSSISGFHWSPYYPGTNTGNMTCSCSPHHTHHFLTSEGSGSGSGSGPASSSHTSISTATISVQSQASTNHPTTVADGGSGGGCTTQCLQLMRSLLEEVDACVHDMGACQVDAALSYQKRACVQCSQVILCKTCYVDPDCMMFLTMICDKLVMLTKKMLWYTMEAMEQHQKDLIESSGGGGRAAAVMGSTNPKVITRPLFAGQYEMDELDEWAGMVQHLSGVQLRKIKMLVEDIQASPGLAEGKMLGKQSAQIIMLKSVKTQVVTLLGRIREALAKDMDVEMVVADL